MKMLNCNRFFILGITCLIHAGCGSSPDRSDEKGGPGAARVATVVSTRSTLRRTAEQPGQIEAFEEAPIHAKLSGYVNSVTVDIGDKVKKGQILAELAVPELQAEAGEKRAMVEEAVAERMQSEAALEVAHSKIASALSKVEEVRAGVQRSDADVARWQSEFARVQQLFNERTLTGSLLDETRSKLKSAEAAREEVRAQVKSAEVSLAESRAFEDKARSDLVAATAHIKVARFESQRADALAGYTKIEAPFDGVVTRRNVDPGHLTIPGTAGAPLFVVARVDLVTIVAKVPEMGASFVNAGDRAEVRVQALGGRTFPGKVSRTAWSLDAATRTLRAEIDMESSGGLLRPGLYAYVSIVAEEHRDAVTAPLSSVFHEGGKARVVVVDSGRASRREVKLGIVDGKRAEILSGLKEGEAVVEANAISLSDGQAVDPIRLDPAAKPKN